MKYLIATDSFKGSLTSMEAAACMQEGIRRIFPDADIRTMPAADGGEGTVASVLAGMPGRAVTETVLDPLGRPVEATYAILDTGEAVIEMAQASGLLLVDAAESDVLSASTYGTGQLIRKALDMGCHTICSGIGGSATNDAEPHGTGARRPPSGRRRKRSPPGGGALGRLAT